ncbi:MAG TPA: response regulator [Acidimicrobiales bacterium]|nr:response regulator [Acidimicrobiales bacterium]
MARVLVVDDEPDIRDIVAINLRLDGHEVLTAADGDQAVEAARDHRPDLIVLDVMMPGRDGFAVLETLKRDRGGMERIPVVLLTARTDRIDRIRGGIEGAVVYLTKPFSVAGLRESVAEVLAVDEGEARRSAVTSALSELARLESGSPAAPESARPRLTRFEPHGPRTDPPAPPTPVIDRSVLSARQAEVLDAVVVAPTLIDAARTLGVSRSYLYATLGRVAHLVGAGSGPEVVRIARLAAGRGASAERAADGRGAADGPPT